jgi:hypothetical protein
VNNEWDAPTLEVTEATLRQICCPIIVANLAPVDTKFIETVPEIHGELKENASVILPLPTADA